MGAGVDDQCPVEILDVVDAVVNQQATPVHFAQLWPPAVDIHVQVHPDHLVRGQEPVADALLERIGVDRRAEVMNVGDVFGFLGGGGQADLRCRLEMVQNFAPRRVVGRTATVALVDDDQVEEVGRQLTEDLLSLFRSCEGLVQPEVNFICRINAPMLVHSQGDLSTGAIVALYGPGMGAELGHLGAEGAKIIDHGLVDQDVAVRQEQHPFLPVGMPVGLPQAPDDLESGVGLAGASGHDQ